MSFWDHTRVETLRRHAAAGFSAGQIVRLMGAKSRNVIIGKCSREGIQLHGAHRNAPDHEQKERLTADCEKAFKLGVSLARVSPPGPVKSELSLVDVLASVERVPRPVAVDPGSSEIGVRRVSLRDLSHTDCRWPLGDPKDKDFAYCGLPSNGGPYCAGHHRVAHR